jgi:hypothetical protein
LWTISKPKKHVMAIIICLKFLSVAAIYGILHLHQNTWLPLTYSLCCLVFSWVPFHVFTQDTQKNCALSAVFLMIYGNYILECKQFFAIFFSIATCIGC